MATFNRIEEIEVWNLARELAQLIWQVSNKGTFARDFALKDQINKSSGSVMDNIAEGHGRGGNREFVNFLSYSKGSNQEVKSQLYRALDRKHISEKDFNIYFLKVEKIDSKLGNLISYLNNSPIRGPKFKRKSNPSTKKTK